MLIKHNNFLKNMFRNILTFSLLFIMAFSLVPYSVVSANNDFKSTGEKIPNQYIVILKDDSSPEIVANEARGNGAEVLHVYDKAVKGFATRVPNAQVLDDIKNDPRVAYIEQDQVVRAFARSAVESFAQTLPPGVDRVDADLSSTQAGNGAGDPVNVDIAIIDTGIDLTHPDLNVVSNVSFVKRVKTGNDDNGHGSHVAGIAAAKDNGIGVVGIAPGAKLWAVKVLSRSGSGYISDVIAGINYVTQNKDVIDVANMSLGCQCFSSTLDSAIHNSVTAGVTYVVAAGNSDADASTFSPANHNDVIAVSAIVDTNGTCGGGGPSTSYGNDDTFASFSNFGTKVDMAAPGVNILSTYKGGSYATLSGTSMASPHVAGAAALYESTHPGASPSEIKAALASSGSVPSTTCDGNGHGYFTGDTDGISEPLLYTAGY